MAGQMRLLILWENEKNNEIVNNNKINGQSDRHCSRKVVTLEQS
jgi:hypothetical protein